MSDAFDDDEMFSGNGSSAGGLDPYEGHPLLLVPSHFGKEEGPENNKTGKAIDIVDTKLISFQDEEPDEDDVRVFGTILVGSLRKAAIFNEAVSEGKQLAQENGLPKMHVGVLQKDTKHQRRGQNAPWILEKVTDGAVLARMRKYALANLRQANPFEEPSES